MFRKHSTAKPVDMFPGVVRHTLSYGDKTLLAEITLLKGSEVPLHSHPHEQIGYVVKGCLIFQIGEEEEELRAGDGYVAPGGVNHRVVALEDSIAIDIFSPVREEYK